MIRKLASEFPPASWAKRGREDFRNWAWPSEILIILFAPTPHRAPGLEFRRGREK